MSIRSGLAGQCGFVAETTYGTAVAASIFVPFISESMKVEQEFVTSDAIIAGRHHMTTEQWAVGNLNTGGSLGLELSDSDMRVLFENMFGSETGVGPYTYIPADLFGTSMTVQIGKPDTGGTVRPHTYAGVKVDSWQIQASHGETVKLGLDLIAQSSTTASAGATALQTASFTAGALPFSFVSCTATVAGSSVNAKQITIDGNNGFAERRFLGSQTVSEPIQGEHSMITGSMQLEFTDLTYEALIATEVAIVTTFSANSKSIVFTLNARIDGDSVNVGGKGVVEQPLPFTAIASGADSTACTVVITE